MNEGINEVQDREEKQNENIRKYEKEGWRGKVDYDLMGENRKRKNRKYRKGKNNENYEEEKQGGGWRFYRYREKEKEG